MDARIWRPLEQCRHDQPLDSNSHILIFQSKSNYLASMRLIQPTKALAVAGRTVDLRIWIKSLKQSTFEDFTARCAGQT